MLPFAALMLVGSMLAVVLIVQSSDDGGFKPLPASEEIATPAASSPDGARIGNVCQGVFRRPAEGAARAFDPYYTKRSSAEGIDIVAGPKVADRAIREAEDTIERVFKNNDLEERLVAEGAYVIILDEAQNVLDMPEFSCLKNTPSENFLSHVCGVADLADYPVVTVSELDLTGSRSGPCRGLNILYHELGHLVHLWTLEPADYFEVPLLFQQALDVGKYRNEYASTNRNEYFAEGTQAFFHYGEVGGGKDRDWLEDYDPALFDLLSSVYNED